MQGPLPLDSGGMEGNEMLFNDASMLVKLKRNAT
jgi:hypothetical protein